MRCKNGDERKGEENETAMDGVGIGEYASEIAKTDRRSVTSWGFGV